MRRLSVLLVLLGFSSLSFSLLVPTQYSSSSSTLLRRPLLTPLRAVVTASDAAPEQPSFETSQGDIVDAAAPPSPPPLEDDAGAAPSAPLSPMAKLRLQTEGGAQSGNSEGKIRADQILPPQSGINNLAILLVAMAAGAFALLQARV